MPEKNKPVWPPPEGRTCYLVYEESGGYQYVVRSNGKNIKFLIRTRDKDDLLETICQDARLHVYKATPRHLIELQGEAHWKYGNEKDGYNYPFADPPEFLLMPDKDEKPEVVVGGWKWIGDGSPTPLPPEIAKFARALGDIASEATKATPAKGVAARNAALLAKNPKCRECGEHLRVSGRSKESDGKNRKTYYRCATHECSEHKCTGICPRYGEAGEKKRGRYDPTTNPKCKTCKEHLRVQGRRRDEAGKILATYYVCKVNGCEDTGTKSDRPPSKPIQDIERDPERKAPTITHDEQGELAECYLDYCVKHKRTKHPNGVRSRGPIFKCFNCAKENKGNPRGGARSGARRGGSLPGRVTANVAESIKNNPQCVTCSERLRVKTSSNKTNYRVTYYRCINKCADIGTKWRKFDLKSGALLSDQATGVKADPSYIVKLKKNPRCLLCGGLQKKGSKRRDGTHSYKCIEGCPSIDSPRLPEPEIAEKFVRVRLAQWNGHLEQDRDDIVQEIMQDLYVTKKIVMKDLLDTERMRRGYIHSQTRLSQDKFTLPSLDAPLKEGEEGSATFADNLVSPEPNPHEELEAREADEEED